MILCVQIYKQIVYVSDIYFLIVLSFTFWIVLTHSQILKCEGLNDTTSTIQQFQHLLLDNLNDCFADIQTFVSELF